MYDTLRKWLLVHRVYKMDILDLRYSVALIHSFLASLRRNWMYSACCSVQWTHKLFSSSAENQAIDAKSLLSQKLYSACSTEMYQKMPRKNGLSAIKGQEGPFSIIFHRPHTTQSGQKKILSNLGFCTSSPTDKKYEVAVGCPEMGQ